MGLAIKPSIAKAPQSPGGRAPPPRSDGQIKLLRCVYDRVAIIVRNHVAPFIRASPQGRVWLRTMYAELHHTVPFAMMRMAVLDTPFGVPCEVPYALHTRNAAVAQALHRIRALLAGVQAEFDRQPADVRARLLNSKPIVLAQIRLANIRHLCDAITTT